MNTKFTFLKTMLFVFAITTSITLQAQDPTAYLHMQFENNLDASTTKDGGVVFEALNANTLGYTIPYGTGTNAQEGTYAIDYSAIADESPEFNLIQNGAAFPATIQSTTDFAILGDAARTFSAWIRYDDRNPDTNGAHCIAQMGDPGSGTQGRVNWNFRAANNDIQIAVGGGNVRHFYDTNLAIEDGTWHHVAFTYAAGAVLDDIKFYVDGVEVSNDGGSNSATVGFNTVSYPLSIGSTATFTQKWFDGGGIDDLRIYDYALTPEEISIIYNGDYITSVEDIIEANKISLYPSPTTGIVNVSGATPNAEYTVFSIVGAIAKQGFLTSNTIDLTSLNSGICFVKVEGQVIKVVLQK